MDVKGIAWIGVDRWTLDNEGPIFQLFMMIVRMGFDGVYGTFLEGVGYMTVFVIIFFHLPNRIFKYPMPWSKNYG